jgi:hypothetical protein
MKNPRFLIYLLYTSGAGSWVGGMPRNMPKLLKKGLQLTDLMAPTHHGFCHTKMLSPPQHESPHNLNFLLTELHKLKELD